MRKYGEWLFIIFIALTNYKIAKFLQALILGQYPDASYVFSLAIPWVLIGLIPAALIYKDAGLIFRSDAIVKNKKNLALHFILVLVGLALFVVFDIDRFFKSVKYPIIFFLFTPIAEELLFRGYIWGRVQKLTTISPVIITSILFGLHHWQYFDYRFTLFAIFQIVYTTILGLYLGNIRKLSESIYLSIILHILINYLTYAL